MDYSKLAEQFLQNAYRYRGSGPRKKFDDSMHGEAFALAYISQHGGTIIPSDISNEMLVSSARVAVILNSLEGKGLVTRQIDPEDRRRVLVGLTQKGQKLAEKRRQSIFDYTVRVLKALGEDDAQELVRLIGKLADLRPEIENSK